MASPYSWILILNNTDNLTAEELRKLVKVRLHRNAPTFDLTIINNKPPVLLLKCSVRGRLERAMDCASVIDDWYRGTEYHGPRDSDICDEVSENLHTQQNKGIAVFGCEQRTASNESRNADNENITNNMKNCSDVNAHFEDQYSTDLPEDLFRCSVGDQAEATVVIPPISIHVSTAAAEMKGWHSNATSSAGSDATLHDCEDWQIAESSSDETSAWTAPPGLDNVWNDQKDLYTELSPYLSEHREVDITKDQVIMLGDMAKDGIVHHAQLEDNDIVYAAVAL